MCLFFGTVLCVYVMIINLVQGYTTFENGKYIGVYPNGKYLTWYEALEYCKNEIGTSLATILNDKDNKQAILAAQGAIEDSLHTAWIGLTTQQKNNSQTGFVFSDGTSFDANAFPPWINLTKGDKDKPNESNKKDICAFVYLDNNPNHNSWSETNCDDNEFIQGFICNSPSTNVGSIDNDNNIYGKRDCLWTGEWLNRDNPNGSGDWETLSGFRKDGINVCNGNIPIDIKCVDTNTNINFDNYSFGNYVALHCSPQQGFLCLDDNDNRYDKCPDFKVQFCCPNKISIG